jgi:hypothetical protein
LPLVASARTLPAFDVLVHHRDRIEHHLDLATQHAGARAGAFLVRHVHDVEPGGRLEELAGHVVRRAGAGRRIVELARLRLRQRDQLLQRLRRHGRIDDQHEVRIVDRRDGREVAHQLERLAGHQRLVDGVGVRHQQQRVAVGRALRDDVGTHDRASAGPVLDDERLPHCFLQPLRDETRIDVCRTARGKRYDDLHRPRRIVLRERARHHGGQQDGKRNTESVHDQGLAMQKGQPRIVRRFRSQGTPSNAASPAHRYEHS